MNAHRSIVENLVSQGVLDALDGMLVDRLRERAQVEPALEAPLTAVVCALCRACAEGSLCLPLDATLEARLAALHEIADLPPEPLATRFLQAMEDGAFARVLGDGGGDEAPKPLVRFGGSLYFHRYWHAERSISEGLAARRGQAAEPGTFEAALRETLEDAPLRGVDGNPLRLTDDQKEALRIALRERVFVLAGGPGTGKTTWTAAWLRAVLRLPGVSPERIRLCAPTGRAARRLGESLRERLADAGDHPVDLAARGMPVTTLHSLLGYRAFEGRFARGPEDPLDADWVLLDEASMADVFLLAALVRALPPRCRLVLAGDPDQLPAVEAGAVLAELLPSPEGSPAPLPSKILEAGHRSRGAVAALGAAVRAGDAEAAVARAGEAVAVEEAFAQGREVARLEPEDGAPLSVALMRAYARDAFGPRDGEPDYATLLERFRRLSAEEELDALPALWRRVARARVLAPLREGAVSAERANRILRELLEPAWKRPGDARGPGFHGAPILIMRNDERTGLSNGDVGLWLQSGEGAVAFFPRADLPGGWLRLQSALLPPHQLGFASTVHKSQGSEYDEVLILLPEAGNRLLAREVLYTAITRARSKVRLHASEAALRESVERRLVRHGGLRRWFERETGPDPAQG